MAFDFFFRPGDSLVTRVRNDCVAYFLSNSDYTHLFWIDADCEFVADVPESALVRADRPLT